MAAADNFKSASFNGIAFPYVDYAVKGSIRHHTHEYPHEPGGVDEPLGRRLYEFSFTCEFDEAMHGVFPGLYPNTLTTLFALFEAETVGDLVIPSVGTFSARCTDWDTRKVAKIRSGEKVNFRFLEVIDIIIIDPTESVVQSLPNEAASILTATQALQTAPLGALPSNAIPTSTDIANAERLVTLVNGLVSAKSANDFAALGASQGVMSFAQKIDAAPYLRYARTFAIVDSLRRVFSGANDTRKDLLQKSRPIVTYTTPRRMSITEVSVAIFGDTSHTRDLLVMNSLEDALHIPSMTAIRHYQPEAKAA